MSDLTLEGHCASCEYWDRDDKDYGFCRRYPQTMKKLCVEWCGEYREACDE